MDSEKPLESQNEFPLTQKSSQFSQSLQDWLAGSDERQIYAILHPMAHGLHRIELSADSFEFGRFPTLKESYNFYGLDNDDLKYSISGKHCRIERNNTGGVTYLIDTSRFGTFVNEKLIGKGNSHQLLNGDLISLCDAKFHVFLYVETVTANDVFPVELTAEYLVSNLIIGKGSMGKVYLGKRRSDTSVTVAIKAIPVKRNSLVQKHRHDGSSLREIKRETEVMLSVKHPNCVHLEKMCQSDTMAYIVMEYIEGGELFTRITAKENHGAGLGENLTKFYAWQLFGALEYLHTNGIVHRDIKPENILLLKKDAYTVAKLTDFGLSRITERSLKTLCGTQIYMAPEIWKAVHYGCKVDVWALGVLIFASLCGYPPFSPDYKDWTLEQQILRGRLVFYKRWNNISVSAREFVRHCLKVDPEKRFSASQALSDKWFQDPIIDEANRVVQSYISKISS